MSLTAGQQLGPYAVVAPLGAGGMGEVYRATDTRLKREVAIKVLPAAFTEDKERLARFERQLLAQLNHTNIAHVYGFESATLGDASSVHFLAMELVEGEDLSGRLKRGAIPVDEAVGIVKQIAEALEEAHEHGIVHRDLKPANVKVTPDGKVKVLDFGLAKAYSGDGGEGSKPELSHSPTMTRQGTEAGMILGTAAYMSPEQARGKNVDKRADVWSFGVVPFEMLTGKPELVVSSSDAEDPVAVSRDGLRLLAGRFPVNGQNTLVIHDLSRPQSEPTVLIRSANMSNVVGGFSPDGHLVVYQTEESGRPEIYVRPANGQDRKWQVSIDGGASPVWSKAGDEIFFLSGPKLLAAPIRARGEDLVVGEPKVLFENRRVLAFDAARDGKRFLIAEDPNPGAKPRLDVVVHWFAAVERKITEASR